MTKQIFSVVSSSLGKSLPGACRWTAERCGGDCSARSCVAHRLRRQVAGSILRLAFEIWTSNGHELRLLLPMSAVSPMTATLRRPLVRERLLQNRAEAASFTPLAESACQDQELAAASARIAMPMPGDVEVLGMGDHGHTASWFPGAEGLAEVMDPGARQLVAPIVAPDAPEPRLDPHRARDLARRAIALEIQGAAKLPFLDRARGRP